MRQHGGAKFITLLNNLRIGVLTERDKELLERQRLIRFMMKQSFLLKIYQREITVITSSMTSVTITPQDTPDETGSFLKGMVQSQIVGLSEHFVLRKGARVMVACNINIKDILIIGDNM